MEKEIKHREEFLNRLVGKKSGYTIPSNYLDNLEDVIYESAIEDNFPKTEGFDIPNNYFTALDDKILQTLDNKSKPKVISLRRQLIQWIPAVAAILIVSFVLFNSIERNSNEVSNEEIMSWLETDLTSVTNEDLALVFEDSELNDLSILSTDISVTTIENYLTNEDISSLLNELN